MTMPHALSSLRSSDSGLTDPQYARAYSPLGLAWAREIDRADAAVERTIALDSEEVTDRKMLAEKVRDSACRWIANGHDATIRGLADTGYGERVNTWLSEIRERLLTYPASPCPAIDGLDAQREREAFGV